MTAKDTTTTTTTATPITGTAEPAADELTGPTAGGAAPVSRSPFAPTLRIMMNVHHDVTALSSGLVESMSDLLTRTYGSDYAVRAVSRSRTGASGEGPRSLAVYIAPAWYAYPTGAKVASPSAALATLRALATALGLDPSDPDAILAAARSLLG